MYFFGWLLLSYFPIMLVAAPYPEQVHLAFNGNLSKMNVVWTTFEEDVSIVYYGRSRYNLPFKSSGSQKKWRSNKITRYNHRAQLTDLSPNTVYYYKIGPRIFSFKTLPQNPQSYKVCIFGDLGYWHGNSTSSIIKNGILGNFDFVIHIGDISYDLHSNDGKTGDNFMNQLEPLISRVPYMVIAGNHEDDGKNFSNFQVRYWMPNSGYKDNQFYSFNLGPIHWVGLSTEYYGYYQNYGKTSVLTQYNWLQEDLKRANANRRNVPWIVSYQHRPMYCSMEFNDDCSRFENRLIRKGSNDMPGLEPLFINQGMDLGFCGHMHAYERFYPVADKKYWKGPNCYHNAVAPVYVMTGSAGCHTPGTKFSNKPVPFSASRINDYGYTIMTVANKTHIHLQQISIDKDEKFVDDFWLSKDPDHIHTLEMRQSSPGIPFPHTDCSSFACRMGFS